MRILNRLVTKHEEVIHDVAYDFYGKRLATCSSDGSIKIWDLQEATGEWKCTEIKMAHNASIWKVAWAHPEFGQVLASCSADRTVCIREEITSDGERKWAKKASLVDARDSVTDIKFAPRHFGFRLATCSADGFVRIYEAIDVMNLAHWPLMEEFEVHKGTNHISWNNSAMGTQMIVVGGEDPDLKIYVHDTGRRRWESVISLSHGSIVHDVSWAPHLGRSYHLIAAALKNSSVGVRIWRLEIDERSRYRITQVTEISDHRAEVWRVEWNITGTVLASSGDDGTVRLWKADLSGRWKNLSTITAVGEDSSASPFSPAGALAPSFTNLPVSDGQS